MDDILLKAGCAARVILSWHLTVRPTQVVELRPDFVALYLSRLETLQSLDLSNPAALQEIAEAQIMQELAWAFNRQIPQELWAELVTRNFDNFASPETLGGAALLIQDLLQGKGLPKAPVIQFSLDDHYSSILSDQDSIELRCGLGETPSQLARDYFSSLSPIGAASTGGCELMVAMNEDAETPSETAGDFIRVYNPSAFAFEWATGPNNVVTLMRENRIMVNEVVLGCGDDYGEKLDIKKAGNIAVGITLTNHSPQEESIQIPAGSVFEAIDPALHIQNVTAAYTHTLKVPAGSQARVTICSHCLNRKRGTPRLTPGRITPFRYTGPLVQNAIWQDVSYPLR